MNAAHTNALTILEHMDHFGECRPLASENCLIFNAG